MTFQPPPPPPPPPAGPPTPPPPPPGQWGPPPGQGPAGGGNFDPKSVNTLDWAIIGAGVLMFIFSFVDWYSYSEKHCSIECGTTLNQSAWSGFFGWFGVLLAIVGSAAVALSLFMPHVKLPMANRVIAVLAYAIAALCVILALFVIPDLSVGGISVDSSKTNTGHDFGYWISLIVVLAGLVLTLMRAQQTNTSLPGPLNKMPKIGK